MFRSTSLAIVSILSAAALTPAAASAASPPSKPAKAPKTAHVAKTHACLKPAVEIAAGAESASLPLVDCNGAAVQSSVVELSILARPGTAEKPKDKTVVAALAKAGPEVAPGIRRIDPRLVERLELVVEHFHKDGQAPRVELVSGYRPRSSGSFHQTGRALDFKLEGVKNEDVVAFCKTLPDTGCGYYPNSSFVHIDARDHGAGHVSWIDTSRPGEAPHYVTAWPPPPAEDGAATAVAPAPALSLPALPAEEHDDAPATGHKKAPAGFLPYF